MKKHSEYDETYLQHLNFVLHDIQKIGWLDGRLKNNGRLNISIR